MAPPQRIVRTYELEAASNGYMLKIQGETVGEVDHYAVGGFRAGTKPETLHKKLISYALTELKEQLEQAIDEADKGRPELELPAATA